MPPTEGGPLSSGKQAYRLMVPIQNNPYQLWSGNPKDAALWDKGYRVERRRCEDAGLQMTKASKPQFRPVVKTPDGSVRQFPSPSTCRKPVASSRPPQAGVERFDRFNQRNRTAA
jgi:hypothetical protein